jgi:hypothetical protein
VAFQNGGKASMHYGGIGGMSLRHPKNNVYNQIDEFF